jgi:D-alanyl-D-alanine carboxypeptidase (penicillin-binding protein 5/6)
MLKAICVVSANDCCVAMAEYIAGSEEAFVNLMNEKAKELGMNDTTFKNCHGIDEDDHLTSAYDISIMSKELLNKYPEITNYTTIWMDSLRNGESELVNTNKLIRTYEGATGLKTGSTSLALYNLSASATRNDLSLIAVVMRAPSPTDRVSNAKTLLDYGFSNYEFIKNSEAGKTVQTVLVEKGVQKSVDLVFEKTTRFCSKERNFF